MNMKETFRLRSLLKSKVYQILCDRISKTVTDYAFEDIHCFRCVSGYSHITDFNDSNESAFCPGVYRWVEYEYISETDLTSIGNCYCTDVYMTQEQIDNIYNHKLSPKDIYDYQSAVLEKFEEFILTEDMQQLFNKLNKDSAINKSGIFILFHARELYFKYKEELMDCFREAYLEFIKDGIFTITFPQFVSALYNRYRFGKIEC